jgi:hypothetical protein
MLLIGVGKVYLPREEFHSHKALLAFACILVLLSTIQHVLIS